ncbi:MAG: DnaD domain protein [Firmicutes bacterium]|nr:DnaD domain protein [Bacillota bacterium]
MSHPDMRDVILLYQKQIGLLSSSQRDQLYKFFEEGMSPFVLGCAILRAKEQKQRNKRISFNYIIAIIKDWMEHGLTTEEAFKDYWIDSHSSSSYRGERNAAAKGLPKRFVRSDYKYTKPDPPPKGFFSFLDD